MKFIFALLAAAGAIWFLLRAKSQSDKTFKDVLEAKRKAGLDDSEDDRHPRQKQDRSV